MPCATPTREAARIFRTTRNGRGPGARNAAARTGVAGTGRISAARLRALSDRGHVVGSYRADTGTRAFLWHRGRSVDLGTLGGTHAVATAVNDRGEVVGTSETADGTTRAFLWRHGELLALDPPADHTSSSAAWITDQGTVIGYASTVTPNTSSSRAVQWTVR